MRPRAANNIIACRCFYSVPSFIEKEQQREHILCHPHIYRTQAVTNICSSTSVCKLIRNSGHIWTILSMFTITVYACRIRTSVFSTVQTQRNSFTSFVSLRFQSPQNTATLSHAASILYNNIVLSLYYKFYLNIIAWQPNAKLRRHNTNKKDKIKEICLRLQRCSHTTYKEYTLRSR